MREYSKKYVATISFDVWVDPDSTTAEGSLEVGHLTGAVDHLVRNIRNLRVSQWKLQSWEPGGVTLGKRGRG